MRKLVNLISVLSLCSFDKLTKLYRASYKLFAFEIQNSTALIPS